MTENLTKPKGPLAIGVLVALLVLFLIYVQLRPEKGAGDLPLSSFTNLPVQEGGRLKPLDTVVRTGLMMTSERQAFRDSEGRRTDASVWGMRLLLDTTGAMNDRVFRIDHPDIVGLMGEHNEERRFFSLEEISPFLGTLQQEFSRVNPEPRLRNSYERGLAKLQEAIQVYDQLAFILIPPPLFGSPEQTYGIVERILADLQADGTSDLNRETVRNAHELFRAQFGRLSARQQVQPIPPGGPNRMDRWHSLGESLLASMQSGQIDPVARSYGRLSGAFQEKDASLMATELESLHRQLRERAGQGELRKIGFERFFNTFSPFYLAMEMYVVAFLLAAISWIIWPRSLATQALCLMGLAFLIHSYGMGARVYIQGRPPVTNLYSSAIFVGWGAVLLCLFLEKRHRNGIASAASALLGFCSLIVAHYLSFSGDTLEMMQAVLDSNFWLATHVPTVTIGYSATFLAGFLALFYVLRAKIPPGIPQPVGRSIESMVYGIVCFALLFSFVGTVLGGIWADQSWGRFWGWDPKENGALMIVLWNALILHARWGKIVNPMGIMQMAIVGNIITAWSWFGTNMLGVGLHSYGFMDSAFFWLVVFVMSQVGFIVLAWMPVEKWIRAGLKIPTRTESTT